MKRLFVTMTQIFCGDATSEFIRSLSHNGHVFCEQMPPSCILDPKRLSGPIVVIEALTTFVGTVSTSCEPIPAKEDCRPVESWRASGIILKNLTAHAPQKSANDGDMVTPT